LGEDPPDDTRFTYAMKTLELRLEPAMFQPTYLLASVRSFCRFSRVSAV